MAFWKPGTIAPGSDVDRANADDAQVVTYNPNLALSLSQQREQLPVFQLRRQILYAVDHYTVVVVVGQTGSGKTTQIPQYLDEAGWTLTGKMIACTQPRRVAATSVAQRVADEMAVKLGREVGYAIRFDDMWTPGTTRIKYMTDGLLIREMMLDPLLLSYSAIMLDEAHERSLSTDILLGLLKKVLRRRPDLKLVVSSATMDAEAFADYFRSTSTDEGEAPVTVCLLSVEGRMFPVDVHYLEEPCSDYLEAARQTVVDINAQEPGGDILVFLTGQEEVESMVTLLNDAAKPGTQGWQLMPVPIYAGLSNDEQLRVFEPAPRGYRKVVVATNIAESSITINGIVYVVDCGFVKIRSYSIRTGIDRLVVVPISKASAQQRSGRAGRVRAGKSYRLYTEAAYHALANNAPPEMQRAQTIRSNLAPVVLQIKALGIDNIVRFDFMSSPPSELMMRALELLYAQSALDDQGHLTTPLGIQMAEFPVEPMLSKTLLASGQFGCSEEVATIAAMLSVQNVFISPSKMRKEAAEEHIKFAVKEGDHLSLFNVYMGFMEANDKVKWCRSFYINYRALTRAVSVRRQLVRYLQRFNVPMVSCGLNHTAIRRCFLAGYFAQAARLHMDGASYRTVRDSVVVFIHPSSVLFKVLPLPPWVFYHEGESWRDPDLPAVETSKVFIREVTAIDPLWLTELAPHFYESAARQKIAQAAFH